MTDGVGDEPGEEHHDAQNQDAIERCLSRISEAAVKLGPLAEELAPSEPWSDIRGIGNWLRHDYPSIIKDLIWKVVAEDLTSLRIASSQAVCQLEGSHPKNDE